uniref:Immunoglobulin domain-containing protein n=1 Tax=Cyprinus carpio TaxID=7962 RepID=A0A8C1PDX4_CYPCA
MFYVLLLFCLCRRPLIGVSGSETNEIQSVSVMEGDSVILKTAETEIREEDDILWRFRGEKSLIAKINRQTKISSTYNGTDERFRDRLKLDYQTGSLTITNITTEHTGLYELQISGVKLTSKTFNVSVYGEERSFVLQIFLFYFTGSIYFIKLCKICGITNTLTNSHYTNYTPTLLFL